MIRFRAPSNWTAESICHNVCERLGIEPFVEYLEHSHKWQLDYGNNTWLRDQGDHYLLSIRYKTPEKLERLVSILKDLGFEILPT